MGLNGGLEALGIPGVPSRFRACCTFLCAEMRGLANASSLQTEVISILVFIFHTLSYAEGDKAASTSWHLISVLEVLSKYASVRRPARGSYP
jgi:hypothetical protein